MFLFSQKKQLKNSELSNISAYMRKSVLKMSERHDLSKKGLTISWGNGNIRSRWPLASFIS